MDKQRAAVSSIDDYIASFPSPVQRQLQVLRATIRATAPEAEEVMSYQMPTFRLHGNLVHFAAYTGHIGFYPAPSGIAAFQERLSSYKGAKGSVQFPLDQPLPLDLLAQPARSAIAEIVRFRVAENSAAAEQKAQQRQSARSQR